MRVITTIRGKSDEWIMVSDMSRAQVDGMRADGIDVGEVMNTIPDWAVASGLRPVWFFVQNAWNFRNPFKA